MIRAGREEGKDEGCEECSRVEEKGAGKRGDERRQTWRGGKFEE